MNAGRGLHIVVNANAKRGGRRIAVQIARALPGASVRLTKSIQEVEGWLRTIRDPRCILSAGGDGSAVALLNALDRALRTSADNRQHMGIRARQRVLELTPDRVADRIATALCLSPQSS